MIKLAIVGSMSFNDYFLMLNSLNTSLNLNEIDSIISGGAFGADKLAERYAKELSSY